MKTRRDFLATSIAGALFASSVQAADKPQTDNEENTTESLQANWTGDEKIAILLYPGFTALDVFGPHHMFILMTGARVELVARTRELVTADTGIQVMPTTTFEECPEDLTILCVPGGTLGTLQAAKDDKIRNFVADRGSRAEWVASVCTGSIILGAAGLLDGYKATGHWLAHDVLEVFGAKPVNKRVVIDRNRITGGGVTAGIDFALHLVQELRGTAYAQATQLFAEYDPQPPLNAGSPEKAPKETVKMLEAMHKPFAEQIRKLADELPAQKS